MPLVWPASAVKSMVVSSGRRPRRVLFGSLAGLSFELDLAHHTQVWLGLYEQEVAGWMRRLANGIRSAVDVGAAEGWYSAYCMAKTSARQVWAFEPSAQARAILARNLALNALAGVVPSPKLVGSKDDAEMVSLDSLLPDLSFPCLVKVDVDGAEAEVLAGAQRLLATRGTSWLIEIHSAELERECRDSLEATGYQVRVARPAWWRFLVREQRPIPVNHWLVAWR